MPIVIIFIKYMGDNDFHLLCTQRGARTLNTVYKKENDESSRFLAFSDKRRIGKQAKPLTPSSNTLNSKRNPDYHSEQSVSQFVF